MTKDEFLKKWIHGRFLSADRAQIARDLDELLGSGAEVSPPPTPPPPAPSRKRATRKRAVR